MYIMEKGWEGDFMEGYDEVERVWMQELMQNLGKEMA